VADILRLLVREDSEMKKSTMSLLISAAFATLAISAGPVHAQVRDERRPPQEPRYYDNVNRDYHSWNNEEDRHYRDFLNDHHRKYKAFSRLSKKQQREYWQWRHDHEDRR
jgi:hypothetical protein